MDSATWLRRVRRAAERAREARDALEPADGGAPDVAAGAAAVATLDGVGKELDGLRRALAEGRVQGAQQAALQNELSAAEAAAVAAAQTADNLGPVLAGKQAVLSVQNRALREQDQAVDAISEQLARVRNIGQHINDEVSLQTGLLDTLEDGVSLGNQRVRDAARGAGQVSQDSGTCRLWITILVLIVVLVLLLTLS